RVLEQEDVALQVLSFTTPGTHVEAPATALSLARSINDAFASIIAARPARFSALANLPLNDPQASVVELERAVRELRLPGAMIFSNVNGIPLSSERYWPLYERANDLDAVLYIHPTYPVGVESMLDFWLMPLLGFPFDTTLAISKLVLTGILDRYPRIKWVLGHLGGTIPFLAERLDRGFHAFRECRTHIDRPPSEYFKRCYFDTVNFDDAALALALAFAGPRQLLAGSDYPHLIGSIPMMRAGVERLPASDEVKAQIAGGNAARIFGLAGSAAG
ncbi:MAG: amidohydrolase family protein, partial [Vicinamibacterales bacterium]